MSDSKMTVPKFGSFRPKPVQVPDEPPDEKKKPEKALDVVKHSKRHRSRSRSRDRNRHRDQDKSRKHESPRQVPVKSCAVSESDISVVDRKGDEKNLIYGNIHRYDVPRFRRTGYGNILGTSRIMKIDRKSSDENSIILIDTRDSDIKRRERYAFVKMDRSRLLRVRPDIQFDETNFSPDYMSLEPLRRVRKRKRLGSVTPGPDSNDERDYRSIHGKEKSTKPDDEAFEYVSESESSEIGGGQSAITEVRRKNVELSRAVELSPHELDAWLALIQHQDLLLRGDDDRRRITNAEIRSTADIKIHMYEKALEKMNELSDREKLQLGIMEEGSKVWEIKYQLEKWEQISKDNIDSLLLWKSYLDFKQTTFSTFCYDEIRDLYLKRVELLDQAASKSADISLYLQLIYVLLRYTIFVRESGFTELAVAIWQSLLEINFLAPPIKDTWKTDFATFWDSEVPRIGENGSQGWRNYTPESEDSNIAETQIDSTEDALEKRDLFKTWATAERVRAKSSRIPAKTMDDVVEDDPYRVVLTHDIEKTLIQIPVSSEETRKSLVNAFLLFCHLPPLPGRPRLDWEGDPFVRGELVDASLSWTAASYLTKKSEDGVTATISDALQMPAPCYQRSPESLFGSWPSLTSPEIWMARYDDDQGPVSYSWLRNACNQLGDAYSTEEFLEYYLGFHWGNEPATIKKTAKGLLKKHPGNLRLYNAYALIEWSRGNKDIASGVFTAALRMNSSTESILLWKSWIWTCLEDPDNPTALKCLLSIPSGAPDLTIEVSPTVLIKAKQHLTSNRDFLLSTGDFEHAVDYAECFALLEYLTSRSNDEPQSANQGDITSALLAINKFSTILSQRSLSEYHELLLQSAARLLVHHVKLGPFRPILLRDQLTTYLNSFPHNTIFLSLYSWNESRLKIDRRVRDMLSSTTSPSYTTQLFKIQWEIQNGTIHSAKAAFESALTSQLSKSSASIWKLYLMFTITHFKPKAKDVWYRAIRACPWVKELYMLGFEKIDEREIGFEEFKGTWKVLGEKELRVHVDLEDRFEELLEG